MRVLQQRGYELVPESTDLVTGGVDEVVINTCGFIQDAKEESIEAILEAVEAKKQGFVSKVSVFGCLSQRYLSELPVEIPEVDEWRGVLSRIVRTPTPVPTLSSWPGLPASLWGRTPWS